MLFDLYRETCTALSVPSYEFPSAESIQHDLATNDGIWGKLSAFRSRLKEFEDEDWVIFRARPYLFQEFLDEWESKFDNESKSEFIIAVLKDIQEHRVRDMFFTLFSLAWDFLFNFRLIILFTYNFSL